MQSAAVRKTRNPPPAVGFYRGGIFKKNAKTVNFELETGLYYYGARYLDPKTSRWLGVDPAMAEYVPVAPVSNEARKHNQNLPGMGGVFNYVNLHVYHYGSNNPIKYVDPDGRQNSQNKTVYRFTVKEYLYINNVMTDNYDIRIYYSTDYDRLDSQRNRIRRNIDRDGLRLVARINNYLTERFLGRRNSDPFNITRVIDIDMITETELLDVSSIEEEVLDNEILVQGYIVDIKDDKQTMRLLYERSLDEDGLGTEKIQRLAE